MTLEELWGALWLGRIHVWLSSWSGTERSWGVGVNQGLRSAQREQLLACGQPPRWSSLRETLISPAPCVFAPTDSRDSFQPLELAVSKDGGDKPEETERG